MLEHPTVHLRRAKGDDEGTPGVLTAPGGFRCLTLELPWRDNRRGHSRIPPGVYGAELVRSPRFGLVYRLYGTAPRDAVLIHSGNWAGDVEQGLRSHVQGCILLGRARGRLEGQKALLMSRPVVVEFMRHMGGLPFTLVVEDSDVDGTA